MKEKLESSLGTFGAVIFYIFRLVASLLPFVMIGAPFLISLLLIFIAQVVPFATPVFWIWGLFCAIRGTQDIWAFTYYALFLIFFLPLIINVIKSFFE